MCYHEAMNVHPLLVHFPIALLTLYALVELARFPVLERWQSLQTTKLFFLFIGTLATIPTLIAGKLAQWALDLPASSHTAEVIKIHSYFALSTATLFTLISLMYASKLYIAARPQVTNGLLRKLAAIPNLTPLLLALVCIGVMLVFVTGTLGATIAYGPDIDPITHFVNHILFGS
jgi:uncharacterized membrane protein